MTLLLNLSPLLILAAIALLASRAKRTFKRTALSTANTQPAENLAPLTAYDLDETYWTRLRWVSGLFFGIALAAVELVLPIPNTRFSPPVTAAISFVIGAPGFGLFFAAWMRRKARLITAGVYSGERWIIDPPPANQFYYQIPCSWIKGTVAIGGVLYIGRGGFLFVPHKQNRSPNQPLEITPIDVVTIAQVAPLARNMIQRLLIPRPQEQLEVTWKGASARFSIPSPADTLVKLTRCLETLQRIPK